MQIIPDLRSDVWHFAGDSDSALNTISTNLLDHDHLSVSQRHVLSELLSSILAKSAKALGCAKGVTHHIELLPGTVPLKQRYDPVSPHKQKIIDEELKKS